MSVNWGKRLDQFDAKLTEVQARSEPIDLSRWERFKDDPAGFNRDILGRELWSKQVEVCEAVRDVPVVVVPAGKSVGKSYLLAGLCLWWLYTRRNSRVIATGPDHRQICSVLFSELRRALAQAPEPLPFEMLTEGFASPQRLVIDGRARWEILGFSAVAHEGFSGQHGGQLLCVVDEASGVLPDIFSAIFGLAANRLVLCGNALRYDSKFRELHDQAAAGAEQIRSITISSLDSPHAKLDESPVGLADWRFINFARFQHGEGSTFWKTCILGEFPGAESARFLPQAWVDACVGDDVTSDELWQEHVNGPVRIAVDVGGGVGRDRSVIVVRNHKRLLEVFSSEWHGVLDEARHRLEPEIISRALKYQVPPSYVTYDRAGIGRSLGSSLAVAGFAGTFGVFGAGKGGPLYQNRRSANAHMLRNRLDPRRQDYVPFYCGGIAEWPALREELLAIHDAPMEMQEGQVKQAIEEKSAWSARLRRSPDIADALIQSFTFI